MVNSGRRGAAASVSDSTLRNEKADAPAVPVDQESPTTEQAEEVFAGIGYWTGNAPYRADSDAQDSEESTRESEGAVSQAASLLANCGRGRDGQPADGSICGSNLA